MKTLRKDKLLIHIAPSRAEMGRKAACDIADCILRLLERKEQINMIFAAAPSQNEVLAALAEDNRIPWQRINAFHMDEYIGIPQDAPQSFANSAAVSRQPRTWATRLGCNRLTTTCSSASMESLR